MLNTYVFWIYDDALLSFNNHIFFHLLWYNHTERLHFHFSLWCIGEGNGNPLQCSCLENPRAWWAAVYGAAQSRTRLKQLSSSSSSMIQSHIEKYHAVKCEMLYLKKYQISQRNTLKTVDTWLSHLPWHILWLNLHAGVHLSKHHKFYLVKEEALVISNDYITLKV